MNPPVPGHVGPVGPVLSPPEFHHREWCRVARKLLSLGGSGKRESAGRMSLIIAVTDGLLLIQVLLICQGGLNCLGQADDKNDLPEQALRDALGIENEKSYFINQEKNQTRDGDGNRI